ncbi:hypothetical protein ACIBH1_05610 [Nonomuraea sp. NPDC050663]|uniref:hypothetical protein n=1 Tax=Nonomuraea sp. NPDC050663 TaxID=3364370 RepID=UPI0037AAE53F
MGANLGVLIQKRVASLLATAPPLCPEQRARAVALLAAPTDLHNAGASTSPQTFTAA